MTHEYDAFMAKDAFKSQRDRVSINIGSVVQREDRVFRIIQVLGLSALSPLT